MYKGASDTLLNFTDAPRSGVSSTGWHQFGSGGARDTWFEGKELSGIYLYTGAGGHCDCGVEAFAGEETFCANGEGSNKLPFLDTGLLTFTVISGAGGGAGAERSAGGINGSCGATRLRTEDRTAITSTCAFG